MLYMSCLLLLAETMLNHKYETGCGPAFIKVDQSPLKKALLSTVWYIQLQNFVKCFHWGMIFFHYHFSACKLDASIFFDGLIERWFLFHCSLRISLNHFRFSKEPCYVTLTHKTHKCCMSSWRWRPRSENVSYERRTWHMWYRRYCCVWGIPRCH